jgi:signal transduction histidine kinase
MRFVSSQAFGTLRELFRETAPSPEQMAARLRAVEKDVVLPVKAVFIAINFYFLYLSRWFEDLALPRPIAQQYVERFFLLYLLINVGVSIVVLRAPRFSLNTVQRIVFFSNFLDGLFIAALTFITGGFDSILYWLFLGLIVRNAVIMPRAVPQLILNGSAILLYFLAGILNLYISPETLMFSEVGQQLRDNTTEPFALRMIVLVLMAVCCYGVQVLFEKQRQAYEEAREFAVRQERLHSAGRLAAQIAHQIKNPLAIIKTTAFSLHRALEQGKTTTGIAQLEIIRDSVERSDQILTNLVGYAQLAEGKVERLKIDEELDRAIDEVFPSAAAYDATIETDYAPQLPALFMQRGHLSEILVNLLQNAREATGGKGHIEVSTRPGADQSIIITVSDNGPGIPNSHTSKIFEAYFSTKEKGTGLGLSIVKHNVEMYGGSISVESELGKGTRFIIELPTRSFMKLQK